MESNAMKEIRQIRDENSRQHLAMSEQERQEELKKSVDWLVTATKKYTDDTHVS